MNDNADTAGKPLPWGFVRFWTDEEVMAAITFLKQERPHVWVELEKLERTTGDLSGSEAVDLQFGALSNLHPECGPREISDLSWQVRKIRRAALGLK